MTTAGVITAITVTEDFKAIIMKHILNAISILLSAIVGFTHIAIVHIICIVWTFQLNPETRWRGKNGRRAKGKFLSRYKSWYKIIKNSYKYFN
jgi:hypothetical protein